uniref:ABC transporter domain-containing protein n=1 Tax=Chromera velia CCMP2878 TaxID=1169474 RepID=A0A0G4HRN8_9ALVE|eukprot:Cvel_8114.t1-p1 / transcript=Cvel_8114.t1 / gene=Cvel_8114 / organism=Chromera_velia_CCMP2878 / gene_product=ABC transporter G family member 22, putative / transcript_product=ABC transporter G family member 22, putative / location=Cvel_scaffold441:59035-64931(+) / protein_length=811 / sequence_SO=supercontig / SO=protein_coding / is_pseudo=false
MTTPVAPRGGITANVLEFTDCKFSVKGKRNEPKKQILKGVSGVVYGGEVLAIMGPSGAGKTTLLSLLTLDRMAGDISGLLTFRKETMTSKVFRAHCAYMPQHDYLPPFLTCREALQYTIDLCDASNATERKEKVDFLLELLGLKSCENTKCGNEFFKGLSGGQKRRLSLGMALAKTPGALFADEPTSGLDSAAAASIMKFLKELAENTGMAIACTIHQPSTSVFNGFDKTLILSAGRTAYSGSATGLVTYLDAIGEPMPANNNPADFMLDLVNKDFSDADRVDRILDQWADYAEKEANGGRGEEGKEEHHPHRGEERAGSLEHSHVSSSVPTVRWNGGEGEGQRGDRGRAGSVSSQLVNEVAQDMTDPHQVPDPHHQPHAQLHNDRNIVPNSPPPNDPPRPSTHNSSGGHQTVLAVSHAPDIPTLHQQQEGPSERPLERFASADRQSIFSAVSAHKGLKVLSKKPESPGPLRQTWVQLQRQFVLTIISRFFYGGWICGVAPMFAVILVNVAWGELQYVKREVKNGTYPVATYLIANFVLQIPYMFLLSAASIGVSCYAIMDFHPSKFGEVWLIYTLLLWAFEAMAQFCSVVSPQPLVNMCVFLGLWFTSFLFSGWFIEPGDVVWPLRAFVYILPLRWTLPSFSQEEVRVSVYGQAREDPNSPVGYVCDANVLPQQCFGRTGLQVLDSVSTVYPTLSTERTFMKDCLLTIAIASAFKIFHVLLFFRATLTYGKPLKIRDENYKSKRLTGTEAKGKGAGGGDLETGGGQRVKAVQVHAPGGRNAVEGGGDLKTGGEGGGLRAENDGLDIPAVP